MSKDQYYPQQYLCAKCNRVSKHYVWASEVDESRHTCECGQQLNYQHMHEEEIGQAPAVGKMTKAQIKADRRKRSALHFQKEIAPTLPKKDRQHFEKKFGKKLG